MTLNMKTYASFIIAAGALLASSCSQESPVAPDNSSLDEMTFNAIHPSALTRATDTAFENGDQMGIYVTEEKKDLQLGGNAVNNECFVFNGKSWAGQRKVYWNKGTYNVYAYYPFSKTVNDTEDYSFSVSTDQSNAKGYSQSDFLWASAAGVQASANPVSLQFSHQMSKVTIQIEKDASFDGNLPDNMQVYIHNTVTEASIDLSTGGVSTAQNAGFKSIRAKKLANNKYTAIVVPQNLESRRPLVEVVSGNVSYLMEGKMSFKQGMHHTITVTVSKRPEQTEIEIGGSIGGWN